MNTCEFEKYFDESIRGELDAQTDIEFQTHLQSCATCPDKLDEFYHIHHILKSRKRPKPAADLEISYHKSLKTSLLINAPAHKISAFLEKLVYTNSLRIRFAEVAVILVIGILIGGYFLTGEEKTRSIPILEPELYSQPVSKVDIEFMNYYLSASDIILLELMNSDNETGEIILTREIAQKLLMKTFMVHEIALRMGEPEILRFLSLMEFILYDISNISPNEAEETMRSVRNLIKEKKLLEMVEDLQKRFKNPGSPQNLPG